MERIVNVSGGKDSTALYLLALDRGKPFSAVFADTGHEWEGTYQFVRELPAKVGGPEIRWVTADYTERLAKMRSTLPERWGKRGVPDSTISRALEILHPTGNAFIDSCLYNGGFPNRIRRHCTEGLKIEPVVTQVYKPLVDRGVHVVAWMGVRKDESRSRNLLTTRQTLTSYDVSYTAFRPLLEWTKDDVLGYHMRHGIKANPLYGKGFTRVGCFPCIYASKADISLIARKFPDHIERLKEWERIIDAGTRAENPTFFGPGKIPAINGKESGSDILSVVEWAKTARGGKQYQMFEKATREQAEMAASCAETGVCE